MHAIFGGGAIVQRACGDRDEPPAVGAIGARERVGTMRRERPRKRIVVRCRFPLVRDRYPSGASVMRGPGAPVYCTVR